MPFDHTKIEPKWQKYWDENKTFKTDCYDDSKPKYYCMDMFPYPSGNGLHVGHPEGYTATDIVSRMKRMQGYNVLHPMGLIHLDYLLNNLQFKQVIILQNLQRKILMFLENKLNH